MKKQRLKRQVNRFVSLLLTVMLTAVGLLGLTGTASADGADTSVLLSSLAAGDTVQFAGYSWIVLNPRTGYVLMEGSLGGLPFDSNGPARAAFDPSAPTNIAYFLNNTFYDSLPFADQLLIQTHSWSTGYYVDEFSGSVDARVGLFSFNEFYAYQNIPGVQTTAFNWWLRTPILYGNDYDFGGVYNGDPTAGLWVLDSEIHARPALYLNPGSKLRGSIVIGKAASQTLAPLLSLDAGDTVNFAGYSWIVLDPGDGYLLMEGFYNPDKTMLPGYSFDSTNSNNFAGSEIEAMLNGSSGGTGGLYGSLPPQDRALIRKNNWSLNSVDNYGETIGHGSVHDYIGLLSQSDWENYSGAVPAPANSFWTLSPTHYDNVVWEITFSGDLTGYSVSETYPAVRPALYLNPGILVSGGAGGMVIGGTYEDVTALSSSGGYALGGGAYQSGDTVVLTAVPEDGWNFVGWTDGSGRLLNASSLSYSFTMDNACHTLMAKFRPVPEITVKNCVAFTVTLNDTGGVLTGTYGGTYGTVTAIAGGSNGNIISGTLNGLSAGTPVEIPLGGGIIRAKAAAPPSTTVDNPSFY